MALLSRRSRQQQRECDSPVVSLKQQRINTASKARPVARLTGPQSPQWEHENTATYMSSGKHAGLHLQKSSGGSAHSSGQGSDSTSATAPPLSPQEALLVRNARMALTSSGLADYLNRDTASLCCSLPVGGTCTPYQQHFLQSTLLTVFHDVSPVLPLVPSRGDFSSLSFLFRFTAMLATHTGVFPATLRKDKLNTPLYETNPRIRSSVQYSATVLFDQFAALHGLLEADVASNGVARLSQVELAVLLMFLSKVPHPAEYFYRRGGHSNATATNATTGVDAGTGGGVGTTGGADAGKVLDTVSNSLLSALSDKQRSPKELSMAVACLAFTVEHHSMAARVLTASNAGQLLKLLLSKCVYPNEVCVSLCECMSVSVISGRDD